MPRLTAMMMSAPIARATSTGQVVGQSAIHQHSPADYRRCNGRRYRHARAHYVGELAFAEYDGLAGGQIGGYCTVGDRQLVELAEALRLVEPAQHRLELHTGDNTLRQQQLTAADPDLGAEQVRAIVLLAADGAFPARWLLLEQQFGRDLADDLFQLGHGRAGSVGCTNDRAHTGPGDAVNWHAQLLDHLEHADVSGAARAAAREHQADLRSIRGVGVRRGLGCGGLRGPCGEQKTKTCEQDTVGQSGHEAVLNGIGAIDAGKTRRFASHRRQGNYAWLRLAVPRTTLRSVFAGMMEVSVASKVMSKTHSTKAGTLRFASFAGPAGSIKSSGRAPATGDVWSHSDFFQPWSGLKRVILVASVWVDGPRFFS